MYGDARNLMLLPRTMKTPDSSNQKTKGLAMNHPHPMPPRTRQHPLLIIAALAVILFCAVGTAAVMGWLPTSHGRTTNGLSDADRAALSAGLQQPGAASDAGYPAAPAPAANLPGQPAPGYALPGQPVTPAPAPAPATAYAPNALAAGGNAAYGDSSAQSSTGAGAGYVSAPATAYASPEAAREARPAHVAQADTGNRWCSNCGNVESIREITTRARGSGVGAGAGAILGGLLGNQVGSGRGRSLATVAGAVGGAVMGNQVEGNMHAYHSYEIRVRLDDGSLRTFHQRSVPAWRTGDRVRIVKGTLHTA
jgi:outer membrane lipoprotein SlyB